MVSDTTFLTEVEMFLASCDSSPLPSTQTRNKTEMGTEPPSKRTRTSDNKETSSEDTSEPKQHKSYYRRRKMARANLRQQVAELEGRLEKAKGTDKDPSHSMWKALAKYHEEERANAESTQRQLCAAIDARGALIHELVTLMQGGVGALGDATHLLEDKNSSEQHQRIRADPLNNSWHISDLEEECGQTDEEDAWRDSRQGQSMLVTSSVESNDALKPVQLMLTFVLIHVLLCTNPKCNSFSIARQPGTPFTSPVHFQTLIGRLHVGCVASRRGEGIPDLLDLPSISKSDDSNDAALADDNEDTAQCKRQDFILKLAIRPCTPSQLADCILRRSCRQLSLRYALPTYFLLRPAAILL